MNTIDPRKQAQVWQRVRGEVGQPQPKPESELLKLMLEEWTSASTYLQLSRQFSGKEAAALQRLFREEQTHATCLRGIDTLITGSKPAIQTPSVGKEPPETVLRKCYGRQMRSLMEYESRAADPEYGPVYRRLAQQEQEHCRTVLELIGGLRK